MKGAQNRLFFTHQKRDYFLPTAHNGAADIYLSSQHQTIKNPVPKTVSTEKFIYDIKLSKPSLL
jgi:hypothetical protein